MGPNLKQTNEISRILMGLTAVLVLFAVGLSTALNYRKKTEFNFVNHRVNPASEAKQPLDLRAGWEFAVVPGDLPLSVIRSDLTIAWQPFDPENPTLHADEISGHYWLRNRFVLKNKHAHPSLVLGLVATFHRTFVNGFFVGGSDFFENVEQYPVDPNILKLGELNEIYVKAFTPTVFLPGITRLGHLGITLGDHGEIQKSIVMDTMQFFVLRTVYLTVTFLTSLILLLFLAFNQSRKHLMYFSVYLLLGTLTLLYDNFYVITALNYPMHRFLKVFSFGAASFVLSACFWNLARRTRLELFSNLGGILFSLVAVIGLLAEETSVAEFSSRYRALFLFSFFFSAIWIGYASFQFIRPLFPAWKGERRAVVRWVYQFMVLSSGALLALVCLSASELAYERFESVDFVVKTLGVTHSFWFSILILGLGAFEHIRSLRRVEFELEKDKFNLELVRVLNGSSDLRSVVYIIQERMCQFVNCERSTIYLVDDVRNNEFLEANFIYGDHSATSLVNRTIPFDQGIIGKVASSRQPLLIADVDKDESFAQEDRSRYKTKSCMVLPLQIEGEFIGILTMADKRNGIAFTRRDLTLIEAIAKDIALICKVAKLKTSLQQQLEGIISALAKMIEQRDPYTEFHSQGVMYLTERLAERVGRPVTNDLKIAAFLHDVGKVFVPKRILNKPGPLNQKERDIIEQHSKWSQDVLKSIPGFEEVATWAGLHHETIDGKGYPYGLSSDLIPLEAQIISVADFIDALATNRAYRPKYPFEKVSELLQEMGRRESFDPKLVEAGVALIQTPEFRKFYGERGASYQPQGNPAAVAVEFYLEGFEQLAGSVEELRTLLERTEHPVPYKLLNQAVSQLKKLGEELGGLATEVSGRVKEHARKKAG